MLHDLAAKHVELEGSMIDQGSGTSTPNVQFGRKVCLLSHRTVPNEANVQFSTPPGPVGSKMTKSSNFVKLVERNALSDKNGSQATDTQACSAAGAQALNGRWQCMRTLYVARRRAPPYRAHRRRARLRHVPWRLGAL